MAGPGSAWATNGYFTDGTSTKNRGMGGAGVALPQDTGGVVVNPATATRIGNRWDVALGVFSPRPRDYVITGNGAGLNGSQESDTNYFPIPGAGYVRKIDEQSAWAFNAVANGGMNTDYALPVLASFGASGKTGVNLEQLFLGLTYSRDLSDMVSVGITGIFAYQVFEAKGLQGAFQGFSIDGANMTNNDEDSSSGFGIRLGAMFDVGNGLTLGASYTPKIDMDEFNKYRGLFAEQGDFDIPSSWVLGLAWEANPKTTVALDFSRINYTDVASVSNPISNFTVLGNAFGSDNGPGFGWDDINVVKLGIQHEYNDNLTLRAGWNHGDNPIASSEVAVNFLAPGVVTNHLTLGLTKQLSKSSELNVAYIRAFDESVSGPIAASFGGGTETISMSQHYIEVGYGKRF